MMRTCKCLLLLFLGGTLLPVGSKAQNISLDALDRDAQLRVERFQGDLRAFAEDLMAARKVSASMARRIAYVAVSEAYRYDIPPVLVFGIMMYETRDLDTKAVSPVGAVGLMQIMPFWKETLGRYFGYDLTDPVINIRYGVWIAAHYLRKTQGDWRRAMLRYNGCVRGTNTPNCHTYPDRVKELAERHARSLCPSRDFVQCMRRPTF